MKKEKGEVKEKQREVSGKSKGKGHENSEKYRQKEQGGAQVTIRTTMASRVLRRLSGE